MIRKFKRDQLRKRVGNKGLQEIWKKFQIRNYGDNYKKVCVYAQIYNRR